MTRYAPLILDEDAANTTALVVVEAHCRWLDIEIALQHAGIAAVFGPQYQLVSAQAGIGCAIVDAPPVRRGFVPIGDSDVGIIRVIGIVAEVGAPDMAPVGAERRGVTEIQGGAAVAHEIPRCIEYGTVICGRYVLAARRQVDTGLPAGATGFGVGRIARARGLPA